MIHFGARKVMPRICGNCGLNPYLSILIMVGLSAFTLCTNGIRVSLLGTAPAYEWHPTHGDKPTHSYAERFNSMSSARFLAAAERGVIAHVKSSGLLGTIER